MQQEKWLLWSLRDVSGDDEKTPSLTKKLFLLNAKELGFHFAE